MNEKTFSLNIAGNNLLRYIYNFQDNVFAHTCMRNLGNSVKITTYEKEN